MKKELESAPPEPREPAARESVELAAKEFREHGEWLTTVPADYPISESRWEDRYASAFALAYSAELRAERDNARLGLKVAGQMLKSTAIERDAAVDRAEASEASLQAVLNILLKGHHYTSFRNAQAALYEIKKIVLGLASTSAPEGTV